jgi:arylsulfatase A-like enzyme
VKPDGVVWSALFVCAGLLLGGCRRHHEAAAHAPVVQEHGPWPNVLLISVDTLRPDHLGCYCYDRDPSPNIDRLAGEGAVFATMISSTSWTLPAHAAMFTGLADSVHGAWDTDRRLVEQHVTLAERLQEVGYTTVGFFSGPTLYPAFGLGQGFDTYIDCTSYPELSAESAQTPGIEVGGALQTAAMADITSPRVYAAVQQWLEGNEQRPFFMFIHMWDVHFDFIPPPPYDTKFDPDYDGSVTGRNFIFDDSINASMPQRDIEHLIALYDGEIAWTDEHIGKILDELERLELDDTTIVMLLADHGTEFFEHGSKGHRHTLFDEVLRIPLVVRWPGHIEPGLRIARQTRMIDVLPTLLDLLGMPAPTDVMGRSVAPLLAGEELAGKALAVSELQTLGRGLSSYRRLDRKLIREEATGSWLVFNLRSDPGEQRPIQNMNNPLVSVMVREANEGRAWLAEFRQKLGFAVSAPVLPRNVRRRLEHLGYIEGEQHDETEDDDD